MSEESHYVETYTPRHFEDTVEIWCPTLDETKVVLGRRYVRHCPMCGDDIEVELSVRSWSKPAPHPDGCECSWCHELEGGADD